MKVNGWTNWDTWETNNWLNNDERMYNLMQLCGSAQEIREYCEEYLKGINVDYDKVNFREIYINNEVNRGER